MAFWALYTAARARLALTRRTGLLPLDLQPRHAAAHRRPEVHAHLVLNIRAGLRPARLLLARENAAEDIAEASTESSARLGRLRRRAAAARPCAPALKTRKIEAAEVERHLAGRRIRARGIRPAAKTRTRSISAARRRLGRRWIDIVRVEAELVINLPLLLVAQNVVCLGDLLEAFLGLLVAGVHVRVILARQLAEGLAHLLRRRGLLHPERAVVVLGLCRRHR